LGVKTKPCHTAKRYDKEETSIMKPTKPNNTVWIVLGTLVLLVVGGLGLMGINAALQGGSMGGRVGIVEYSGVITDEGSSSVLGIATGGAREFIKDLERAGRDTTIRAVVVRINSPGGSPAASQEMYGAIRRLRQKKPVVCSIGDVAASGGYYMAVACEKIYASPSSVTGSIGVISSMINVSELFKRYGIKDVTQTSGRYKGGNSPFRPTDPALVQYEKVVLRNIYNQFVNDVLAGRKDKLTRAQLLKLADGRIYTGEQAKKNGLIDELGGFHEAIEAAGKLAMIKGTPSTTNLSEGGLFGKLDSGSSRNAWSDAALKVGNDFATTAGKAFAETLVQQLKAEGQTQKLPQLQ
jgi:protease-4